MTNSERRPLGELARMMELSLKHDAAQRPDVIQEAIDRLREFEGTVIEGWLVCEIVEDVEDPNSVRVYHVATKPHWEDDDRCILILKNPQEPEK